MRPWQVEGMRLDITCTFNAAFEGLDLQARRGEGAPPRGGLLHALPLPVRCACRLPAAPARQLQMLCAPHRL